MKILLCILVINEKKSLEVIGPKLLVACKEEDFINDIIAIDGGSTDGTVELLKDLGIKIIRQREPGRGAAIIEIINNIETDAIIFFSPDGNEDPEDLIRFKYFLDNGADLVIASRMMKGAKNEEDADVFKFRKWANNFFNYLAHIFFQKKDGVFITDSINGYRAIKREFASKLKLDASDFTIEYQMSIRSFQQNNAFIIEFPTNEGQRIAGETGAKSIITGVKFIIRLIKELLIKKTLY